MSTSSLHHAFGIRGHQELLALITVCGGGDLLHLPGGAHTCRRLGLRLARGQAAGHVQRRLPGTCPSGARVTTIRKALPIRAASNARPVALSVRSRCLSPIPGRTYTSGSSSGMLLELRRGHDHPRCRAASGGRLWTGIKEDPETRSFAAFPPGPSSSASSGGDRHRSRSPWPRGHRYPTGVVMDLEKREGRPRRRRRQGADAPKLALEAAPALQGEDRGVRAT